MANTTLLVTNGTRTVVINSQQGRIWWNLYVNSKVVDGMLVDGDITLTRGRAKTLKGAKQAASRALEVK